MSPECPNCGESLDESAVTGGLCPLCLMREAVAHIAHDEGIAKARADWQPPGIEQLRGLVPGIEPKRLVGRGGFGAVYAAQQTGLGREAALKILPFIGAPDPVHRERFEREARSLARLDHPGVVKVYTAGLAGNTAYLVLEWIDGGSLDTLLRFGPLPASTAVQIGIAIAEALAAASRAGVIHRDIKPGNILIRRGAISSDHPAKQLPEGSVVLADFGIAQLMAAAESEEGPAGVTLTHQEQVIGTPAYMAPEQRDPSAEIDARCDLYALGVVLHEMVTGRRPGYADADRAEVPDQLAALIAKCTAENPADRPSDAEEAAACLRSFRLPAPIGARHRKPWITAATCLVAGIITGAFVMADAGQELSNGVSGKAKEDQQAAHEAIKKDIDAASQSGPQAVSVNVIVSFSNIEYKPWGRDAYSLHLNYEFQDGLIPKRDRTYVLVVTAGSGSRVEKTWEGSYLATWPKSFMSMFVTPRPTDRKPYTVHLEERDPLGNRARISEVIELSAG